MSELLSFYYDLQLPRDGRRTLSAVLVNTALIARNAWRLIPAYRGRAGKDQWLASTLEESCAPASMSYLLRWVRTEPAFERMVTTMRECRTGKRRIAEGLPRSMPALRHFAHKTGSMGSIANDAGIVEFTSDRFGVISGMTFQSAAPPSVRDAVIAESATAIVSSWSAFLD